jgi:hypothetical protein
LQESLRPDQYESYRNRGYLEVASGKFGGRTYRVDGWRPVGVYEHGQFMGAVCIRPRTGMPGPDIVLARKLMIEGAEADFLRAGNWLSPAWRPAGISPTLFLLFVLVSPWLRTLGVTRGLFVGTALLALTSLLLLRWRRRFARRSGLQIDVVGQELL